MTDLEREVAEYQFGPYRLILQRGDKIRPARLLRGDAEIKDLARSPQACRLLIYLLERCQNPTETKRVVEYLWPGERAEELRDQKRSLADLVARLRNALE